jgi:hypothetical protein
MNGVFLSAIQTYSGIAFVCFRAFDDRNGISPNRPTHNNEFRDIEAAFAKFEFRHERLSLTNPLTQLNLRNASVLTSLDEQLDHFLVEVRTK